MIAVGICPMCADYIDAKGRFKELPVFLQYCAGCESEGLCQAFVVPGYLGDPSCTDCLSMTHCETHHKVEGLYPFKGAL